MNTSRRPAPPPASSGELHAEMQQLLDTHGFYSPVELLLATNRLGYDDYQAWRRGRHPTLDTLLRDGVDETRTYLGEADTWARALRLQAESVSFFSTNASSGVELNASADPDLAHLLHIEYRRDADVAQPDLFLDGAQAQIQNEIVNAINAHDAAAASVTIGRLAKLDATHWAIDHALTLIDALGATPLDRPDEALKRLEAMETRWLPAASALLRSGARDFLSPLWRDIGRGLEDIDHGPLDPRQHASWAYLNGLDWVNLKRTVLGTPNWESEPLLRTWLALAQWRLAEYRDATRSWFALCWQFPAHFAECVESPTFPNASLQRAWEDAQNQNMDPPITAPWFPAWVLIEHPGYARSIGTCGGASDPERAYDHLVALRTGHSDREDLDHRRALKDLHADLLGRYLALLDT
ncbi:MAG: hypothetical protein OXK76_00935 [Gammaproteobacteria bacterium]|nr:hypothetical protein [Gammaproteobacteria bacterium]